MRPAYETASAKAAARVCAIDGGTASASARSIDVTRSRMRPAISCFDCNGSSIASSCEINRGGVRINLESRIGARDVVGDDEIDLFARQFLTRVRNHVVCFSGEPDEQRTMAADSQLAHGRDRQGYRASSST